MLPCNPLIPFLRYSFIGFLFQFVAIVPLRGQCNLSAPAVSGTTQLNCGQTTQLGGLGVGSQLRWYKQSTGGVPLGFGTSYTTPAILGADTFYLEDVTHTASSQTFNYTGSQQTFTVPSGVYSINVDVRGAQGGTYSTAPGGLGGRVQSTLRVLPGQVLFVFVGQHVGNSTAGGWNGGGTGVGNGRGGGGASDIRVGGNSLTDRIVVAGGGGGAGWNCGSNQERGGAGGGSGTAQNGFYCNSNTNATYIGYGALTNAGGQNNGANTGGGSFGLGGPANSTSGGGGGGGWYGGGGARYYAGGGGGSSHANAVLNSNISHTQGFQSGNGQVVISWNAISCASPRTAIPIATSGPLSAPTVSGNTSIICGQTTALTASGTGSILRWYTDSVGGTLLGSNATYTTPALLTSTTYYVENSDQVSGSRTFNFSSTEETFVVPDGVSSLTVDVRGARGGNAYGLSWAQGGFGGRVTATIAVTPGQVLYLNVGGEGPHGDWQNLYHPGGWNGGGAGYKYGGSGGGASDIRTSSGNLNTRIVVAGGGGGGGYYTSTNTTNDRGGPGGGLTGGNGFYSNGNTNTSWIGSGGTPTAGGSRGTSGSGNANGSFGVGGQASSNCCTYGSGGGGGGWYGGGGSYYAGGGGGSSYTGANVSNVSHTQGFQNGDGQIILSWNASVCNSVRTAVPVLVNDTVVAPTVSGVTAICGTPATLTASGSSGNFRWYNVASGGVSLANTASFTSPNVFVPTTYYVEATSVPNAPHCISPRVAVMVNTIPVPNPTVTNDTVVCGNPVSFTASGSTGNYMWFSVPSGGTSFSGNASIAPTPLSSTTYYVEAVSDAGPLSGSSTFNYTGGVQTFVVPSGVFAITFDVQGAQGGIYSTAQGGLGGRVTGTLQVTPGEILNIYVGQQPTSTPGGWNGGGNGVSNGRGGGGGSDIRVGGTSTNNRVVAAGGGGGAGWNCGGNQERGGNGGGSGNAQDGFHCNNFNSSYSGRGATQTAGGANNGYCNCNGGQFFQGGNGFTTNCGGGGGGYWGGGGAGYYSGGGGGSSYSNPNLTSNVQHTQGFRTGNGQVVISWSKQVCVSQRIAVQAVIQNLADPIVSDDTVSCSNSATLQTSGSSGFYAWFTQPSGGTSFAQGSFLATSPIFQPTTYYVQAFNPSNTCISNRLPVTVYVDSLPAPLVSGNDTVCDSGSATFVASGGTGSYTWHSVAGGAVISTGTTYSTGVQNDTVIVFVRYGTGGCFSPYSQGTLLITPTPSASITAPDSLCSGDAAILLGVQSSGGLWTGSGIMNAGSGLFNPALANLGSNTLVYSVTQSICSDIDSVTIVVSQGPNASISDPGSLCSIAPPIALQSQTAGGIWVGNGIIDSISGAFNPSLAATGSNQIVYSVSNQGCTSSDTLWLTVFAMPDASLSPISSLCSSGSPVSLVSQTPGGVYSGNGILNGVLGIFDPSLAQVGSNMVVYQVSVNGCSSSDTLTVMVNASPSATITSPGVLCNNQSLIVLQAASAGGVWSGPGVVNGLLGTFDPQTAPLGTLNIQYHVSQNGCQDSSSIQLVVNQAPDASIVSSPSEICSNASPVMLGGLFGGGTWSGSGIVNAQNGILDPSLMQPGLNQIQYQLSLNGCSDQKTVGIQRLQAPNGTILSTPNQVCDNSGNLSLFAVSPGGFWSGNGIINAAQGTFSPTFAGNGTAQVVYSVSSNNCFDSDTIQILVVASPVVNISPSGIQEFCEGTPFSISGSGASSYQWFLNGQPILGSTSSSIQAVQSGSYSVVGSDQGCSSSSLLAQVSMNPAPDIISITVPSVCEGLVSSFSNVSVVAQNSGSVINGYQWDYGDGNTGTGVFPTHSYAVAGQYLVTLTVSTNKGCTQSMSQAVFVNPIPQFVSATAPSVCYPSQAGFSANATVLGINNASISSYSWNFGNGFTANGSSAAHQYSQPGPYSWTVTATSNHGCSSVHHGVIDVFKKPSADFLATSVCNNVPSQFIDISDAFGDAIASWSWNFGDGTGVSSQQNPIYQYNGAPGNYPVSLTIQTASGCTDTRYQFVSVSASPNPQWTASIMGLNSLNFSPVNPNPNVNFIWHFPHDNTYYYQTNVSKSFPGPGNYQVCLTAQQFGCSISSCDNIYISPLAETKYENSNFLVYPNPFSEDVTIQWSGRGIEPVEVNCFDLSGRLLFSKSYLGINAEMDITINMSEIDLSMGVYILEVRQGEFKSYERLVRELKP
jgi:hypothetical protein